MKRSEGSSRRRLGKLAVALAFPAFLVAIWEVAFWAGWLPRSQSAPPSEIVVTVGALITEGSLLFRALASVRRLAVGVLAGSMGGTAVGLLTARVPGMDRFLNPTLQFLAPIPVVIWIPFAIMLLGVGELYQTGMVALSAFFLLQMYTFAAVRAIRGKYRQLSDMYEHSFPSRIRHVLLPGIAPNLVGGLRLSLIIGWIVLFMVEFGSNEPGRTGLAYLIRQERGVGRIEDAFAGVLFLALIAFIFDLALVRLERWTNRWRREYDEGIF